MSKPTSVRLDEQLSARLDTLASLTERPKTWHIERALRDYISKEMEFLEAVEEGIRAAEAGDLIDHETVMQEIDELLAHFPGDEQ